jgi:glycine/D-amino acid oxidase-like deaminating enzyme
MTSTTTQHETPKHVLIAGAGVIGLSTAYYLQKKFGISTTLVDPSGIIAPAASGKAGGFLALDWNDGSPIRRLARRSFQLHQELAESFGADKLQYRRLTCAAISVDSSRRVRRPKGKKLEGVEWADQSEKNIDNIEKESSVLGMRTLGDESTIAQVHPKFLCENLWEAISSDSGSRLIHGTVAAAQYKNGKLVGAKLSDETVLEADALLFACGPWTANVVTGVKYHSVIIPTNQVLSQCVFFSGCGDLEVYVRPDSTAYCTAFPDDAIEVMERPGEEEVRLEVVDQILRSVRLVSGEDGALSQQPQIQQACYLPTTPDHLPIMGRVPPEAVGGDQCYLAAGHSCWGILLGPATGECMAHLIATGRCSEHVDLDPFDPARFRGLRMVPR